MRNAKRRTGALSPVLILLALWLVPAYAVAGPLDMNSPPGDPVSPEYTLQDVIDQLDGKDVTPRNGFTGPGADAFSGGLPASTGDDPLDRPLVDQIMDRVQHPSRVVPAVSTSFSDDSGVRLPAGNPRFTTDPVQGIVRDNLSGLIWLYDPLKCEPAGSTNVPSLTLAAAIARADQLGEGSAVDCGLADGSQPGDWRIPTIAELWTLFDFRFNPPISNVAGTGSGAAYIMEDADRPILNIYNKEFWSRTDVPQSPTLNALTLKSTSGLLNVRNKSQAWAIFLPVRGGKFSAPVAEARISSGGGFFQSLLVETGAQVSLDGSQSYFPGHAGVTPDSYAWALAAPAGSSATFDDPARVDPSFTADSSGQYEVVLQVLFGTAASHTSQSGARVTVTANVPPTANDATFATEEDTALEEFFTSVNPDADAFDPIQDQLTYSIVDQGALGTAVLTDPATGAFTYTPDANATGQDTVTFTVSDGLHESAIGTVTINVTPVPDAPTNDVLPVVSGTFEAGQVLSATTGDWTNNALPPATISFGYQWYRTDAGGDLPIDGATAANYTLTADDVTAGSVRVEVTATANGESATASSAPYPPAI